MTELLITEGDGSSGTLVLAHGAGAAMDSVSMNEAATAIASRGIRVVRFEFGYMAGRRDGVRRPPPRAETLKDEYRHAVAQVIAGGDAGGPVVIGGKAMGVLGVHVATSGDAWAYSVMRRLSDLHVVVGVK